MSRRKQIELPTLQQSPQIPNGWTIIVRIGLLFSFFFLLHGPFDALKRELWRHLGEAARARIESSPLLAWVVSLLLNICELALAWWIGGKLERFLRRLR